MSGTEPFSFNEENVPDPDWDDVVKATEGLNLHEMDFNRINKLDPYRDDPVIENENDSDDTGVMDENINAPES